MRMMKGTTLSVLALDFRCEPGIRPGIDSAMPSWIRVRVNLVVRCGPG